LLNKINVILKGRFVKGDLSLLKVISIHKGIINLLDKNTGYLISLIENKENMTGMSLLVPDLFTNDISWIERDMVFDVEKGISVVVVMRGLIPLFTIDYKKAPCWPGIPPQYVNEPDKRKNDLLHIKQYLKTGDSFLSILTNQCNTSFQIKAKDILENNINIEKNKISGLEKLIGLGQGLTPSGDDFITGVLLAEKFFNISILINKNSIKNRLEKTTYAGKTMLHLALEGSFPIYLLTFLDEISEPQNNETFLKTINKASEHGSTSGRDTIAGFYWYKNIINSKKRSGFF